MKAEAFILGAAALAASWAVTGRLAQYLRARGVLDLPDPRRLHREPRPRGGGIGFVAVTLAAVAVSATLGLFPWSAVAGPFVGASLVAAVGWAEDRSGVSIGFRLLAQLIAAVWAVWWIGTESAGAIEDGGLTGLVFGLAVIGLVWSTNLVNFMDGSDGYAATEAVFVALAGALLTGRGQLEPGGLVAMITAGAVAGFLRWNWPPARVFMGDVGSSFLGFLLGCLGLMAWGQGGGVSLTVWIVLGAVFLVDATATLLRRMFGGERWWQAHRAHAYQRAASGGLGHVGVVSVLLVLDGVLAGIAWLVSSTRVTPVMGLAFAGATVLGWYIWVEWQWPWRREGAGTR